MIFAAELNPCLTSPCQNNGHCVMDLYRFCGVNMTVYVSTETKVLQTSLEAECSCPPGIKGNYCENGTYNIFEV